MSAAFGRGTHTPQSQNGAVNLGTPTPVTPTPPPTTANNSRVHHDAIETQISKTEQSQIKLIHHASSKSRKKTSKQKLIAAPTLSVSCSLPSSHAAPEPPEGYEWHRDLYHHTTNPVLGRTALVKELIRSVRGRVGGWLAHYMGRC